MIKKLNQIALFVVMLGVLDLGLVSVLALGKLYGDPDVTQSIPFWDAQIAFLVDVLK